MHKFLGNGFQKVIYQRALQYEMHQAGLTFQRQIGQSIHIKTYPNPLAIEQPIYYKDLPEPIGDRWADLIVEDKILVFLVDTVLSVKGKQAKNQFPPLKQR